jgi:hypothetical protein
MKRSLHTAVFLLTTATFALFLRTHGDEGALASLPLLHAFTQSTKGDELYSWLTGGARRCTLTTGTTV